MGNHVFNPLHADRVEKTSKDVLEKFSQDEIRLIKATFKDLSLRSPGKTIDRTTFLKHFPLPGLHGEMLFDIFDHKGNGEIDFEEFISGLAVACKGSFEERFELVFKIYDITKDGYISPQELRTMLHHVPNEALQQWNDNKAQKVELPKEETAGQDSERSSSQNSIGSDLPEALQIHINTQRKFENSLRMYPFTDEKIPKQADSNDINTNKIIETLVEEAFGTKKLSEEEKLSFESFKDWVTKNPEVMVLFDSVFSGFGGQAIQNDASFSPANAFSPPKRPATPPAKPFSFLLRSSSHPHPKRDEIRDEGERSSSSSHFGDLGGAGSISTSRNSNSYSSRLCDLDKDPTTTHDPEGENESHICLKEGSLLKLGRRSKIMQSRFYKLYGNILYYYNSERSSSPSGVIMMSGCFVDPLDLSESRYYGLTIVTGKGGERDERVLYAKSREERDEWIKVLRKASRDRKFTKKYVLKHKIGTGKFSNVYLCKSKATGTERAVKLIKKSHLTDDEKELLRTEVAILRLVDHPSIVKLVDVFETVENMYLVMELLKGGELYHCIVGRPRFSAEEAYVLLKQLMEGIHYLHSAGIVHRDMKPENILLSKPMPKGSRLDSSYQVKLADFGLSKLVAPNEILKLPCGTISYVAPELLSQKGYGIEADLWSIGVIVYLVVRGKLPFNSEDKDEIIDEILNNEIEWEKDPVFAKMPSGLVQIIKGLLEKEPKRRFTAKQVLEHPWMKEMEAKAIVVSSKTKTEGISVPEET